MSIIDNLKEDTKHDLGHVEEKLETTEGRKWVKWAVYGMLGLVVILFASCVMQSVFAPRRVAQPLEYNQPVAVQQPVVMQSNPDPMAGVLTGMAIGTMMSNGQRYDGHNGYMDSHYTGPPRTVVINKTTVINKPTPVVPVATAPVTKPVDKVANPGDATAVAEKAKMQAVADRKASIMKARSISTKSNFSSFSKSASSSSRKSSGARK